MLSRSAFRTAVLCSLFAVGLSLAVARPCDAQAGRDGPPNDAPATQPGRRPPPNEGRPPRGQRSPDGAALDRLRQAVGRLSLTEEQRPQVDQIFQEARENLRELLPRLRDMGPDERREEMQTLTRGVVDEVNALLTPDQKTTFRDELEKMRRDAPPPTRPGTRPGAGPGAAPGPPPQPADPAGRAGRMLGELRSALDEMELTPEQDEKIDAAMVALRDDVRKLAEESGGDRQAMAGALREKLQAFRGTVEEILTDPQRQELRLRMEATQRPRDGGERPATRPSTRPGRGSDSEPPPPTGGNEMAGASAAGGTTTPPTVDANTMIGDGERRRERNAPPADAAPHDGGAFLERITTPAGLAVGQPLPETLAVVTLTGKERPLRGYLPRGKSLVVIFGSASSPAFRDRIADLPSFLSETARDAEVLVIYTREQHPAGEWDVTRNEQDGVTRAAHADLEARLAAAKSFRTDTGLRADLVADTMADAALTTLVGGNEAAHCAALIFAADGTLVARQDWFDPTGIPAIVARKPE